MEAIDWIEQIKARPDYDIEVVSALTALDYDRKFLQDLISVLITRVEALEQRIGR
jgi:hypothetical protein